MKIAAIQLNVGADVEANLVQLGGQVRRAAAEGARVVALPENALYMGPIEGRLALASPLTPGCAWVDTLSALAREVGCWLVVGGVPESSGDPHRPYNSAFVLNPEGEVTARYRKVHLFDIDLPGGPRLCESEHTTPGDRAVTTTLDDVGIGLTICYDLRFPELYRALLEDTRVRVLFVPSAFTVPTGRAHWHALLRARAIENQCWVVAPAQVGIHPPGDRTTYGHSLIVDPWGEVVAELGAGVGFVAVEADFAKQDALRGRLPALSHRRRLQGVDRS
jgi:predicted amidohydrolase